MDDNYKIKAVEPKDLRMVWPNIRQDVMDMERSDEMIPEDVYHQCMIGESVLFLLHTSDKWLGWMVVKKINEALHIWMLHSKENYDVMSVYKDELMNIAKIADCIKITFSTSRLGWARVAPKHDFKLTMAYYECDVK